MSLSSTLHLVPDFDEADSQTPTPGFPPLVAVPKRPTSDAIEDLVDQIATGDRKAFAELYGLTASRVFGLVLRILRDPSQSEEVGQEVFLEIWQTASRFERGKGRAMTWMFTMAHRRAIDRVRASQSSRDRDLRVGVRDYVAHHDPVGEFAEVVWESQRVKQAMGTLSRIQREAIELSYFGGLSHSEVAERTGVSVGTAKTRMRDGLIKLRAALAA